MGRYDLKIFAQTIGPQAENQVYTLMAQPSFKGSKVRIMPDVHVGKGCVVGFTATMTDKIIPNVIGVDIGCGMLAAELGKAEIDFAALDKFIKAKIPSGAGVRKEVLEAELIQKLRCFNQLDRMTRLEGSCGTLGGGNHFIEVDEDEDGNKYLVIHSGSRNLGLQVANYYQKLAIRLCKDDAKEERNALIKRLTAEDRHEEIGDALKLLTMRHAEKSKTPNELCFLEGYPMDNYLFDMKICQEFAVRNRAKIAEDILKFLGIGRVESFETVHNFIDERGIIRKGAIPAYEGQKVLIPMNMRDGCLVCRGLGNQDWNYSAPHGAGRLMSRGEARSRLTVEEYQKTMSGIFTTTATAATLDEAPQAYKPMEEIVALIEPTVELLAIIKPIYNFKAS